MSKTKKRKQDSSSENVDTDDEKNSTSSKSEDKLDFDDASEVDEMFNFKQLHDISHTVVLPGSMWGVHKKTGGKSAFIHINEDMVIDKTVEFDKSCVPIVKVKGVLIDVPEVKSKSHLECLLRAVDAIKKPPKQERTLRKRPEPKTPKPVKKTQVKKAKVEKVQSSRESSPTSEKERSATPEKRVLRNRDKTPVEKKSEKKPRFAKKSTAKPIKIVNTPVIIKEEVDLDETPKKEVKKSSNRPSRGETSKSYHEATDSEEEEEEEEEEPVVKKTEEPKEVKKTKVGRPRRTNQWEMEENLSVIGAKCIVGCCQNSMLQTKSAGKNISYYRFPMDDKLAEKWKDKCKLTGRIPKSARICSDHFKKEDFEGCATPGSQAYKRTLKPKAVPSVYLMTKRVSEVKEKPVRRRGKRSESGTKIVSSKSIEKDESSPEPSDESESDSPSPPRKIKKEETVTAKSPPPKAPLVDLSDESSEESDAYEEVIQVRITNMSAESTDSESDEVAVMKKRKKVLKKKKPQDDKYKDYDVETLEIELKSDDSDPEIRHMKKTLDAHLNKPKHVPTPPVKTVPTPPVSKPLILTPARSPLLKPGTQMNRTILQKTPRFSQNGVQTPQATPTGPKSVHWNITPKEQNGNKVVFEVNRTEKAAIPVKSPSLPGQSLAKLLSGKNKPDKDTIIKIIDQKITENYDIVNTKKVVRKNVELVKSIPKPESKMIMKSVQVINDEGKIVTKEVASPKIEFQKAEVQKAPEAEMPQINDPELDESQFIEITNDQIEFVSSEDIIIEETHVEEKEKSEHVNEDQIIFVCQDEDKLNEKIEVPIENQGEDSYGKPQTISIQRKSGSEVIPNKLKIPATEHSEQASKAGKEFLDTFFFNNSNPEVMFESGEIGKPHEIQELLQQNDVDFSKVLILNDSNVQWGEIHPDQIQGNQLYFIRQEDDGHTSQDQNQPFDENQFNMECLEVEVIPPESAS